MTGFARGPCTELDQSQNAWSSLRARNQLDQVDRRKKVTVWIEGTPVSGSRRTAEAERSEGEGGSGGSQSEQRSDLEQPLLCFAGCSRQQDNIGCSDIAVNGWPFIALTLHLEIAICPSNPSGSALI
jgi:hypothetical protein